MEVGSLVIGVIDATVGICALVSIFSDGKGLGDLVILDFPVIRNLFEPMCRLISLFFLNVADKDESLFSVPVVSTWFSVKRHAKRIYRYTNILNYADVTTLYKEQGY